MDLKELKELLRTFKDSEICITRHAHKRIQDKRRKIDYGKVLRLIKTQKGLYKFEMQKGRNPKEEKFKLWFRLNYVFDMNIYIVIILNKEKGLNRLEIISAHKVRRKIQREIRKWE